MIHAMGGKRSSSHSLFATPQMGPYAHQVHLRINARNVLLLQRGDQRTDGEYDAGHIKRAPRRQATLQLHLEERRNAER